MSTRAVILAGTVRVRRGSTRVRGGGGTETAGASQLAIFSISSKSSVSSLSIFLSEGRERRIQREPRTDRSGRRQGRGSLGRARPPPPCRRPPCAPEVAARPSAPGTRRPSCPGEGEGRDRARALPGLTEMLLDSIQDVHAVLAVHHVHGQAPLAKAAGAPDPVQVGLVVRVPVLVHGEVKVDDDRHLFHVDPCVRESWTRVSTGDRNRRRPVRPTLTQLRRKAGSGTGQLWGWDTGRWQNPEGEDGPSWCWPNSGISQRAPAGSEDLEKQLTPHWGQEEQAPSSATSQHSRLLWTVSSAESPPQARPQNSISPKPPQPPTHEDPPAAPSLAGQDPASAHRGRTRWW